LAPLAPPLAAFPFLALDFALGFGFGLALVLVAFALGAYFSFLTSLVFLIFFDF